MDRKTAPARHITQERLISLDLIQDNCDRSQKERDRQTNEILSDLTKGAQIEAGQLTFDWRTKRIIRSG
jgi:hypothetical protein